jgi:dUTP pyrophosphatase
MKIKVVNKSKHHLAQYDSEASAGIYLREYPDVDVLLKPIVRSIFFKCIFLEIPIGYKAQIRQRSVLSGKNEITVLNSHETIDSDFKDEVCNVKVNLSAENFVNRDRKRICQMGIAKHEKMEWVKTGSLVDLERETGVFGNTGNK